MTVLCDCAPSRFACRVAIPGMVADSMPVWLTLTTPVVSAWDKRGPDFASLATDVGVFVTTLQVTCEVTFCCVPSLYVAVAVDCSADPLAILLLVGSTTSEVMLAAGFTVTAAVALRLLNSAITLTFVAGLFVRAAVASPFTLIVRTEALLEVQVTVFVKSPV